MPPCSHLGPRLAYEDGEPINETVPCTSCGSKNGTKEFSVWACELFEECLPHYRPTPEQRSEYASRPEAIQLCDGCDRRV